jgi:Cu/Ag efflux protein CusF
MALQTVRFYQRSGLLAVAGFISALMACVMGVAWATEADSGRIEIAQARETKPAGASASGVIREIDRANSRIKIDHGPISTIGMPAMTMTFKVKNPALLDQVKQGDQVNFEIEQSGLGWIITNLNRK